MAKYIITDKNEARLGDGTYHGILADMCEGKVVRAGHCRRDENGNYEVWGGSIQYGINAQPEDAKLLNKLI